MTENLHNSSFSIDRRRFLQLGLGTVGAALTRAEKVLAVGTEKSTFKARVVKLKEAPPHDTQELETITDYCSQAPAGYCIQQTVDESQVLFVLEAAGYQKLLDQYYWGNGTAMSAGSRHRFLYPHDQLYQASAALLEKETQKSQVSPEIEQLFAAYRTELALGNVSPRVYFYELLPEGKQTLPSESVFDAAEFLAAVDRGRPYDERDLRLGEYQAKIEKLVEAIKKEIRGGQFIEQAGTRHDSFIAYLTLLREAIIGIGFQNFPKKENGEEFNHFYSPEKVRSGKLNILLRRVPPVGDCAEHGLALYLLSEHFGSDIFEQLLVGRMKFDALGEDPEYHDINLFVLKAVDPTTGKNLVYATDNGYYSGWNGCGLAFGPYLGLDEFKQAMMEGSQVTDVIPSELDLLHIPNAKKLMFEPVVFANEYEEYWRWAGSEFNQIPKDLVIGGVLAALLGLSAASFASGIKSKEN